MTEANPETGALSIEQATQQISGLLGGGEEAKQEEQPQPQDGQPGEEPQPEQPESPDEGGTGEEESHQPSPVDLKAEGKRLITVKIDGEEKQIPLEELRNGYQRESDYRNKTSEIAEQRRQHEAQRQRDQMELRQNADQLRTMYQEFQADLIGSQPDPEMLNESSPKYNPTQYVKDQAAFNAKRERYQGRLGQMQARHNQQLLEAQQAESQRLVAERAKLIDAIPEFGDEKKSADLIRDARKTLMSYGYTAKELGGLSDSRAVRIAVDLARLKAAKSAGEQKKVTPVPGKYVKPGGALGDGGKAEGVKSAMDSHRKAQSLDTATAAIKALTRKK